MSSGQYEPDRDTLQRPDPSAVAFVHGLTLVLLPDEYAVSRLAADAAIPAWADGEGFVSISRSRNELSIVARAERTPPGHVTDGAWRCLRLVGQFAFDETGIVASIVGPLAEAKLGVFVVSTYDGDHIMVKSGSFQSSFAALERAGHRIVDEYVDTGVAIHQSR